MSGWLLIPTSETTFFSPQDYGRLRIVLAEDRSVERIDGQIGDEVYAMPRLRPTPQVAG